MDLQQAKKLVQKTLNASFDRAKFIQFIKELLNDIDEGRAKKANKHYVSHAFHEHIKSYERIGVYTVPEGGEMDIFIVYLEKETTLERARTLQRNFIAHNLKKKTIKEAGLVAFVSPNLDDWRFSLVKMDYSLGETESGKVKVQEELTPSKRFSFVVGKNENSHTAQKQLLPILKNDEHNPTLKEIEKAFSIETVTKEFFNKYKDLFLHFKEELDKILIKDSDIKEDFDSKGINTADFAKKLLGQIVFLYFLQRKGWLGVKKNDEWGDGPKNLLRALFEKKYCEYENFFNEVLEPLFYEALATDRGDIAYYSRFDCRIPFLNGGLFEPLQNYDWENTDIEIPNELFSNDIKTKEGDIGSGILDFFDRYNFTIKEDEPLEKEVAIDPEMLGKVFENLLEIKDRKSKGAYYTPREIVHYMCQESLINYLATELEGKVPREDIETFIHLGDFAVEHDMAKTQGIVKDDGKYKLPKSIHEHALLIDEKLANITVCDPAIGSGAFPVGMMNEIIRARGALNATKAFEKTKRKRTPYFFKRHAIQNSLYGVDIDPGAVEIAKLRLWLSLVVDEDDMNDIKPLPNLDYKIMQGNSLLEEYEGVKLFDESLILDTEKEKKQRLEEIKKRKSELQQEYFKLHSDGKLSDVRKTEIEKEMKVLGKEESGLNKIETSENGNLFSGESQAKKKSEELNRLHKEFFNVAQRGRKNEIKRKIDELEWELIEETLKEQGKEKELPKLEKMKVKNNKPFFLWKLHFAEVFKEKGGFDVVIANPPYIRIQDLPKDEKTALKKSFNAATRSYDIYVLFDEKGISLLKPEGIFCYIQPNKFFNSDYGIGIRSYISSNKYLKKIVNFGASQIFSAATTYTCILICQKKDNQIFEYIDFNENCLDEAFLDFSRGRESDIIIHEAFENNHITSSNWVFGKSVVLDLFLKIEKQSKPLSHYVENIFQGVVTSADKIYILEKNEDGFYSKFLSKTVDLEDEFLKPLLKGKEIKRYFIAPNKYWLIFPYTKGKLINENDFESLYPKTWKYLLECEQELRERENNKMDHKSWYAYVYPKNLECFNAKKLITQVLAKKASMSMDKEGRYYFVGGGNAGGYGIALKEGGGIELRYLLGLLNSSLLDFYLKHHSSRFQNGFYSYAKRFIEKLPVKIVPHHEQEKLIDLVDKIIEQKKLRKKDSVALLENKVDRLVYAIYGLTPEEIQIIGNHV